ncbi:hypothetical protein JCM3770_003959 [Rhodotorula araucariae]
MPSDAGTPDSLFSAPATPAPDAAAFAGASSAPGGGAPAFVPRAVKRRPAAPRASASAVLSATAVRPPTPALVQTRPVEVSSTAVAGAPLTPAQPLKLSQHERDRLETILTTVETGLSDYGLCVHRAAGGKGGGGGLLERFKEGKEWLHISQILTLPPVRALTGSIVDVQKALRLRESPIVKIDETDFQVGRQEVPDVQRLQALDAADWDDAVVYLEDIPFSSVSGDRSLTLFLASALSTVPQRIIVPPLYDRANPLALDPFGSSGAGEHSQADAFRAAQDTQQGKRRARPLPKSGGPFKGFAFVLVPNKDEASRILKEWSWEGADGGSSAAEGEEEDVDGEDENEDEDAEMGEAEVPEQGTMSAKVGPTGKKEKEKLSCAERARQGGMRALSYDRWLDLKDEYLAYKRSLETVIEAQHEGKLSALRNPPTQRDEPPHLAKQGSARDPPSSSGRRAGKRAASPTSPAFDGDVSLPSTSAGPSSSKRPKRASSPTAVLNSRLRRIRTPSPGLDLASEAALEVAGAFPAACVLWVRNVHEKSGRTSLKALFGALLETLQEGSGKGVEYVDYEKGLDSCYLRFSSPTLASLIHDHLTATPSLHLSPTALSPLSALSPSSRTAAESDLRRPLAATLLAGDAERKYWANVPEATRKAARHAAGGIVGLLKEPGMGGGGAGTGERGGGGRRGGRGKRRNDGGVAREQAQRQATHAHAEGEEETAVVEEPQKKRKKPSRL